MLHALILFAEEKGGDARPFWAEPLFPMLLIAALFLFVVVLPARRKERRQREDLFSKLKKNDEVVTSSGIIGIVANIKETGDEVTLKVDESSNVRLRVLRSSIVRILNTEKSKEGSPKTDNSEK